MQQAVADGHIDLEVGRIRQPLHLADPQRRQQQPKARDCHRKWVQVDTCYCVKRLLRQVGRNAAGLVARPFLD